MSAIINTHMKSSSFHLWSFSFIRVEKQNVLLLINNCKLSSATDVNGNNLTGF